MTNVISKKWQMIPQDWRSVIRHAVIVGIVAILTELAQFALKQDFGQWTPIIILVVSTGLKWIQKFGSTTTYTQ